MNRRGAGIGFLIVLAALVIVMLLYAQVWKALSPTVMDIKATTEGKEGAEKPAIPDHGQKEAAAEVRRRDLPDLQQMKKETDKHAAAVRDAQRQTGD